MNGDRLMLDSQRDRQIAIDDIQIAIDDIQIDR